MPENAKWFFTVVGMLLTMLAIPLAAIAQSVRVTPSPSPTLNLSAVKFEELDFATQGSNGCGRCMPPLDMLKNKQLKVGLTPIGTTSNWKGEVLLNRQGNQTKIEVSLGAVKGPQGTYYLFAVDQRGKPFKLGKIDLTISGNQEFSTPLDKFSLIVSREAELRGGSPVAMRNTSPEMIR